MIGTIIGLVSIGVGIAKLMQDTNNSGTSAVAGITLKQLEKALNENTNDLKSFISEELDKRKVDEFNSKIFSLFQKVRDYQLLNSIEDESRALKIEKLIDLKDEIADVKNELITFSFTSPIDTGLAGYPYYLMAASLSIAIYQECAKNKVFEYPNGLIVGEIIDATNHCKNMHINWAKWHPRRYRQIIGMGSLKGYYHRGLKKHFARKEYKKLPSMIAANCSEVYVVKLYYEFYKDNKYNLEHIDTLVKLEVNFDLGKGESTIKNLYDPQALINFCAPLFISKYNNAIKRKELDVKKDWDEIYKSYIEPSFTLFDEWKRLKESYKYKRPTKKQDLKRIVIDNASVSAVLDIIKD